MRSSRDSRPRPFPRPDLAPPPPLGSSAAWVPASTSDHFLLDPELPAGSLLAALYLVTAIPREQGNRRGCLSRRRRSPGKGVMGGVSEWGRHTRVGVSGINATGPCLSVPTALCQDPGTGSWHHLPPTPRSSQSRLPGPPACPPGCHRPDSLAALWASVSSPQALCPEQDPLEPSGYPGLVSASSLGSPENLPEPSRRSERPHPL